MIQPSPVLFGFDHSQSLLVYLHPETGRPTTISTKRMKELGWQADEAEFRKCLPRVDKALVDVVPAGMAPPGFNGRRR